MTSAEQQTLMNTSKLSEPVPSLHLTLFEQQLCAWRLLSATLHLFGNHRNRPRPHSASGPIAANCEHNKCTHAVDFGRKS